MKSFSLIAIVFISVLSYNCNQKKTVADQEIYPVYKAKERVEIDGDLSDKAWSSGQEVELTYFYTEDSVKERQKTWGKVMWSDSMIYVALRAEDKYLTARERNWDGAPFLDDCGEIFITPLPVPDKMHFGFEVNLFKVANDFIFIHDYYPGSFASIKSYNPDYEVALQWDGTLNDNSDIDQGWTMEFAIPTKLFFKVGPFSELKTGVQWRFNLLRQDRNELESERRVSTTYFPCLEPYGDVHSPRAFGLMEFKD